MGYGPEESKNETEKFVQATPKYKIGTVIRYYDEKRRGIMHYGEVILVQITRQGVLYQTQDHVVVKEENVKAEFYEMPF